MQLREQSKLFIIISLATIPIQLPVEIYFSTRVPAKDANLGDKALGPEQDFVTGQTTNTSLILDVIWMGACISGLEAFGGAHAVVGVAALASGAQFVVAGDASKIKLCPNRKPHIAGQSPRRKQHSTPIRWEDAEYAKLRKEELDARKQASALSDNWTHVLDSAESALGRDRHVENSKLSEQYANQNQAASASSRPTTAQSIASQKNAVGREQRNLKSHRSQSKKFARDANENFTRINTPKGNTRTTRVYPQPLNVCASGIERVVTPINIAGNSKHTPVDRVGDCGIYSRTYEAPRRDVDHAALTTHVRGSRIDSSHAISGAPTVNRRGSLEWYQRLGGLSRRLSFLRDRGHEDRVRRRASLLLR